VGGVIGSSLKLSQKVMTTQKEKRKKKMATISETSKEWKKSQGGVAAKKYVCHSTGEPKNNTRRGLKGPNEWREARYHGQKRTADVGVPKDATGGYNKCPRRQPRKGLDSVKNRAEERKKRQPTGGRGKKGTWPHRGEDLILFLKW